MNFYKTNANYPTSDNNKVIALAKKAKVWVQKFWEFSCYYGEYKASLHAKKK